MSSVPVFVGLLGGPVGICLSVFVCFVVCLCRFGCVGTCFDLWFVLMWVGLVFLGRHR